MKFKTILFSSISIFLLQSHLSFAQGIKRDLHDNILIIVECKIKEGKFDEFIKTATYMSEVTAKAEPTALTYEWTISRDSTTCFILERYASSEASMLHNKNFQENFAKMFDEVVDFVGFTVYGNPNEELKKAFGEAGENSRVKVAGFSR